VILTHVFAFGVPTAVAVLGAVAAAATRGVASVVFAVVSGLGCLVLLYDAFMIGVFSPRMKRILKAVVRQSAQKSPKDDQA
jgi:hypothetical protein